MSEPSITHVVLFGDDLGRMPRIRDLGPGQLERQLLPGAGDDWRLSLVRADDVLSRSPLAQVPADATHVVISLEGNRAIAASGMLQGHPGSYEEALARLSLAADEFETVIEGLIRSALATRLPVAICTMYLPLHRHPVKQRAAATALAIFNDRILRQAIAAGISVVDLRPICAAPGDYSASGLLSRSALSRVAALIWRALAEDKRGRISLYRPL